MGGWVGVHAQSVCLGPQGNLAILQNPPECVCVSVAVGEPRNIADPANRPFMESITKGECPAELDPGSRSQQVSVNLVRSEKPYEAPAKPRYKAFSGSGQTLAGGLCFVSCHCLHVERTATMLRLI